MDMQSIGHTLIRRLWVSSLVVWTFVSVVWDNPAWKPKAVVPCVLQCKTWELVGLIVSPPGPYNL